MTTRFFSEDRNHPQPSHVLVSEGQQRRLSESAPPRHHTPPPRRHGRTEPRDSVLPARKRTLAVVTDTDTRKCRRCRTPRPVDEFVLLTHPRFAHAASDSSNAARYWCATCLRESAFAKDRDVKAALAALIRHRAEARAEADEAARITEAMAYERATNGLALRLFDRAAADPAFASALRLATSALDFPRADLEAVV